MELMSPPNAVCALPRPFILAEAALSSLEKVNASSIDWACKSAHAITDINKKGILYLSFIEVYYYWILILYILNKGRLLGSSFVQFSHYLLEDPDDLELLPPDEDLDDPPPDMEEPDDLELLPPP